MPLKPTTKKSDPVFSLGTNEWQQMALTPSQEAVARVLFAEQHGWTKIDAEKMVGVPPIGLQVFRPLPVPGMESSKGVHRHCVKCWAEIRGSDSRCPECDYQEIIVCHPEFCGSS